MNYTLSLIGVGGFALRLWLTHYKLEDELDFRRNYVSRYISLYYFIAMILAFENEIFNIALVTALPIMLISFVGWDIPFFLKFKHRTYWKKNKPWLIVERITMHPPIIATAIWMYATGFQNFITTPHTVWPIIAAVLLFYIPYLTMDSRITKKYIHPTGMSILFGATLSVIWIFIFIFVFL